MAVQIECCFEFSQRTARINFINHGLASTFLVVEEMSVDAIYVLSQTG